MRDSIVGVLLLGAALALVAFEVWAGVHERADCRERLGRYECTHGWVGNHAVEMCKCEGAAR